MTMSLQSRVRPDTPVRSITSDGRGDVCFATDPLLGTPQLAVVGVVALGTVVDDVAVEPPLVVVVFATVVVERRVVVVRALECLPLPPQAAKLTANATISTISLGTS